MAVQTRIWLTVHCATAQAAAHSIQARAWLAGSAAAPGARGIRPWKVRAAAT